MFGALGALAALEARRRTGRGQVVDAAIYESVLGVTESLVTEWQAAGHVRQRTGPTLPGIAPSNVYPTRDGQLIIAANQDSVFRRLVDVMGMPELATDERFVNHQARGRNMAEIDAIIAEWAQQFDSADLQDRLNAAGVPAGLVYEPKDMLADPQFTARGSIADRQGRAPRRTGDARDRAQAQRDARRDQVDRAAAGRGHRRGAHRGARADRRAGGDAARPGRDRPRARTRRRRAAG